MPGRVRRQKRFDLEPMELLNARAALFHQIETAEKLTRKLDIPELTAVIADIGEEARQVFQHNL